MHHAHTLQHICAIPPSCQRAVFSLKVWTGMQQSRVPFICSMRLMPKAQAMRTAHECSQRSMLAGCYTYDDAITSHT